uniref:Protein kinase domain-containing protein n=1 Tax=viral metagenome TaxID=1070528 RepID=A0A6C0J338_9ZZZZ
MSNKNIESNLKKLLKGEKACIPEHFLKVPSYNSPTLRTGKGRPISEGAFGKMYRGSINDNGRRYVAYKEIDTSESIDGAFEFEFKVAEKLKEFAVPEMYLFKKCPIQDKTPKKVRKKNGTLVDLGAFPKRTKPKDILYMELLNGMSFNSWWKTKPSLDAMKSVIVQVFDNLYRINQKFPDFRHRDLHGGNVMVNPDALKTQYTWDVDLGRKVIRNDPGGSFRSRLGSPDIKKYKRTNAGVEATIIDFGLSYWSRRMPNPETADGGYEGAGIYGHGIGPGTIYYDIHRFLYIIYVKVRQPGTLNERAIKNFIEELIPNKEFLEFNGKFTSEGYLLSDYHVALRANLPTFKTILTHPFLTGDKSPNRPKTLAEALKKIGAMKVKTPPKIKTKTPSPKLSTTERKKKMNNAIKKAAAVLAKPKAKPAPLRRPGAVRPNPVPEIQPASPELGPTARAIKKLMENQAVNVEAIRLKMGLPRKIGGEPLPQNLMTPSARKKFNEKVKKKMVENNEAPYGVMSPSNMMEYARKIESGRKKAANKLNAKHKEIKATKGKTPTPVRLKEKFSFVNVKGKKREFVRKFAYDRALAKNKAERAKKNEYWRSFVDVNGKKQEFESKSAYHEAKQKNLQAYAAKMQAKINNQIEMGRKARLNPQKYSFVDWYGRKREYVRKGAYEKALAKNKAFRVEMAKPTFSERALVKRQQRGQPFYMMTPQNVRNAIQGGKNMKFVGGSKGFKTVTPKAKTPTPKAKWSNANNKQFMELLAREKNAQRKLANKMNKARPLKNGPLDPAVAYALKTPKPSTAKKVVKNYMNRFVNKLDKDERNMLKKKICQP